MTLFIAITRIIRWQDNMEINHLFSLVPDISWATLPPSLICVVHNHCNPSPKRTMARVRFEKGESGFKNNNFQVIGNLVVLIRAS